MSQKKWVLLVTVFFCFFFCSGFRTAAPRSFSDASLPEKDELQKGRVVGAQGEAFWTESVQKEALDKSSREWLEEYGIPYRVDNVKMLPQGYGTPSFEIVENQYYTFDLSLGNQKIAGLTGSFSLLDTDFSIHWTSVVVTKDGGFFIQVPGRIIRYEALPGRMEKRAVYQLPSFQNKEKPAESVPLFLKSGGAVGNGGTLFSWQIVLEDGVQTEEALFDRAGSFISSVIIQEAGNPEIVKVAGGLGYLVCIGEDSLFVAYYDGVLEGLGRVDWLSEKVENPQNSAESLVMGRVSYREGAGGWQEYISIYQKSSGVSWLSRNRQVIGASGEFADFISKVLFNREGDPLQKAPMAHFEGNTIRVDFPSADAALIVDFSSYCLTYSSHYSASLLDNSGSLEEKPRAILLDTSTDGRYEIWKVNMRYQKNAQWGSTVLYDTVTGQVEDFHGMTQMGDFHITFIDEQTAGLFYFHQDPFFRTGEEEADIVAERKATGQEFFLYDLPTGRKRSIPLDFSAFAYSYFIWDYAYDQAEGQHVFLGYQMYISSLPPENGAGEFYGNYTLSFFDAEGHYLKTNMTDIAPFGGNGYYSVPSLRLQKDGRFLLRDPQNKKNNKIYDPRTGTSFSEDQDDRTQVAIGRRGTDSLQELEEILTVFPQWKEWADVPDRERRV